VGIDLGTTNSAVAWVDASPGAARAPLHRFEIPQTVAPGEVSPQPTLPSFLYFPTREEHEAGGIALPWEATPEPLAGVFARDHGALVPARQVSSAKSWLSNPSIDRRARLLPWTAEATSRMSPVDARRPCSATCGMPGTTPRRPATHRSPWSVRRSSSPYRHRSTRKRAS
jgi:molecular chaperone DnaK (HSP70)